MPNANTLPLLMVVTQARLCHVTTGDDAVSLRFTGKITGGRVGGSLEKGGYSWKRAKYGTQEPEGKRMLSL